MSAQEAPVPLSDAQWPEARSFQRIYAGHPQYQARLVKALLGFRQDLLEWKHDERTAAAVVTVIRAFREEFPEFTIDGFEAEGDIGTGVYRLDDRLTSALTSLGIQEQEKE